MRGYLDLGSATVKMKIGGASIAGSEADRGPSRGGGRGPLPRRRRERQLRPPHRARVRRRAGAVRPVLVRGGGDPLDYALQAELAPATLALATGGISSPSGPPDLLRFRAAWPPTTTGSSSTVRSPTGSSDVCGRSVLGASMAASRGWSPRRPSMSLHIAAGFHLGGDGPIPVCSALGGICRWHDVVEGHLRLPDLRAPGSRPRATCSRCFAKSRALDRAR